MSKHDKRIICLSNLQKQINEVKPKTKQKSIKLQYLRR